MQIETNTALPAIELVEKAFYTPDQVAAMLHVSKYTIVRAIESGSLRAAKVASMWRIKGEHISEYIESLTPFKKRKAGISARS